MKTEIEEILAEETAGTPLYLVEVEVSNQHIDVYLDADGGVNLEDCAKTNRKLHERLEEKGFDTGKFIIDVSSPGIERPLQSLRDYMKNVGRKLEIKIQDGKLLKGVLVFVNDHQLMLKIGAGHKVKNEILNFNDIIEAIVTI